MINQHDSNQMELINNPSELERISQEVLHIASSLGATDVEVNVAANKGFQVSARQGDVEQVEYHQDKAVEIMVFLGKRSGVASISDLRPAAIEAAVKAALHFAQYTDEDPAAGLAEREELAFNYPKLQLAFPYDLSVSQAIKMACECEQEALATDHRIMSAEEVSVAAAQSLYLYANSRGFCGYYPSTRYDMSCALVAKEAVEMQRDYSYSVSVDFKHLDSPSKLAQEAADKVLHRLGARRLPTMKAPVIFAAEEARSLWGHLISAISGGNLYRKASFLVDHLNKKIFPDFIHLQEQPHLDLGLGSAPFDGDGVATRANIFVESGFLRSYVLGTYAARQLQLRSTGNAGGVHNLCVTANEKDLKSLLKKMQRGLLVTEMMGSGANILTGDYSRGVGGFWVEHGEIQYPVHEITIAGKLQDMFAHIIAVANDVDCRGNIRTGSVLIEEMMIAGD